MNHVKLNSSVNDILLAMKYDPSSSLPSGFTVVLDENNKVLGVISDSDIRKQVVLPGKNPLELTARNLMRSDFLFG